MLSGGPENFGGRQITAFYPKKDAGSGKRSVPGDLKMGAEQTIRRPMTVFFFHQPKFTLLWGILQLFDRSTALYYSANK
jgi:hypothetical protein